jgi:hypothetical protein
MFRQAKFKAHNLPENFFHCDDSFQKKFPHYLSESRKDHRNLDNDEARRREMTTTEMTLEGLQSQEILLLETANSVYRFSVIDTINRIGKLSGGIFGDNPTTAGFLSSVSPQEDYQTEDFRKVKIGSQAIFVYQSSEGLNHFVTSPIKKLTHSKQLNRSLYK